MELNFTHPEKASLPIIPVTPSGMDTEVNFVQSLNEVWPMYETVAGMSTVVKPVQPSKQLSPMPVRVEGNVIEERAVQSEKADVPIPVIFSGIDICIRLLHIQYLQPIITQYFIDNKSEIWLLFLIAHSKR